MPKLNRRIFLLLLIFLVILCDQVSKNWVREHVTSEDRIELMGSYVVLTYVENMGALLGFAETFSPGTKRILLIGMPFLILAVLCYYIFASEKPDKIVTLTLSLVAGGGWGNLYDRFVYGSVTDFLYIDVNLFKTGIFNLADIAISAGIAILFFYSLFFKK